MLLLSGGSGDTGPVLLAALAAHPTSTETPNVTSAAPPAPPSSAATPLSPAAAPAPPDGPLVLSLTPVSLTPALAGAPGAHAIPAPDSNALHDADQASAHCHVNRRPATLNVSAAPVASLPITASSLFPPPTEAEAEPVLEPVNVPAPEPATVRQHTAPDALRLRRPPPVSLPLSPVASSRDRASLPTPLSSSSLPQQTGRLLRSLEARPRTSSFGSFPASHQATATAAAAAATTATAATVSLSSRHGDAKQSQSTEHAPGRAGCASGHSAPEAARTGVAKRLRHALMVASTPATDGSSAAPAHGKRQGDSAATVGREDGAPAVVHSAVPSPIAIAPVESASGFHPEPTTSHLPSSPANAVLTAAEPPGPLLELPHGSSSTPASASPFPSVPVAAPGTSVASGSHAALTVFHQQRQLGPLRNSTPPAFRARARHETDSSAGATGSPLATPATAAWGRARAELSSVSTPLTGGVAAGAPLSCPASPLVRCEVPIVGAAAQVATLPVEKTIRVTPGDGDNEDDLLVPIAITRLLPVEASLPDTATTIETSTPATTVLGALALAAAAAVAIAAPAEASPPTVVTTSSRSTPSLASPPTVFAPLTVTSPSSPRASGMPTFSAVNTSPEVAPPLASCTSFNLPAAVPQAAPAGIPPCPSPPAPALSAYTPSSPSSSPSSSCAAAALPAPPSRRSLLLRRAALAPHGTRVAVLAVPARPAATTSTVPSALAPPHQGVPPSPGGSAPMSSPQSAQSLWQLNSSLASITGASATSLPDVPHPDMSPPAHSTPPPPPPLPQALPLPPPPPPRPRSSSQPPAARTLGGTPALATALGDVPTAIAAAGAASSGASNSTPVVPSVVTCFSSPPTPRRSFDDPSAHQLATPAPCLPAARAGPRVSFLLGGDYACTSDAGDDRRANKGREGADGAESNTDTGDNDGGSIGGETGEKGGEGEGAGVGESEDEGREVEEGGAEDDGEPGPATSISMVVTTHAGSTTADGIAALSDYRFMQCVRGRESGGGAAWEGNGASCGEVRAASSGSAGGGAGTSEDQPASFEANATGQQYGDGAKTFAGAVCVLTCSLDSSVPRRALRATPPHPPLTSTLVCAAPQLSSPGRDPRDGLHHVPRGQQEDEDARRSGLLTPSSFLPHSPSVVASSPAPRPAIRSAQH